MLSKPILADERAREIISIEFLTKFRFRKGYLEVQTIPDKKYLSNFDFSENGKEAGNAARERLSMLRINNKNKNILRIFSFEKLVSNFFIKKLNK